MRKLHAIAITLLLGGCSLVYDGSDFQHGAGTDSGMPTSDTGMPSVDTGVDGAMPACHDAAGCPGSMLYCNTATGTCAAGCDEASDCQGTGHACDANVHTCTAPISCSTSSDCMGDAFCLTGACAPCDGDGDHYYNSHATDAECGVGHPLHPNGNDCNDTAANIHPYAAVDCSTAPPVVESCGFPMLPPLTGITVSESGLSAPFTLFREGGGYSILGSHLQLVVGSDAPTLSDTSGTAMPGGFAAVLLSGGSGRLLAGLHFAVSGTASHPIDLFHDFAPSDFAMGTGHASSSGQNVLTLFATSGPAETNVALSSSPIDGSPLLPLTRAAVGGTGSFLTGTDAVAPAAVADGASGAIGVVAMSPGGSGAPFVAGFSPLPDAQTGPANVSPSTWIAGAGSMVIWLASDSSIGVWNGTENDAISPQTISFGSYVEPSAAIPQVMSPAFRAGLAVAYEPGASHVQHYIAAIPIGNTARPPMGGHLILARFSAMRPTDPMSHPSVSAQLHPLVIGTELHAESGVAVFAPDLAHTLVAYRDGNDVVARFVSTTEVDTTMPEDPETIPMIHLAAGESVRAIAAAGGAFPDDPSYPGTGHAVGRLVVAAVVDSTAGPSEIRVRAIEACIPTVPAH